ncbi:MAG: hypothetical protein OEQ39_14520 [Gammaproteobacteria bacterium]|nr:hypothetical protein [Gammaproteobacteria bacterium]MDH3464915.1 hypothetical protein [Gammaproteobacteria bacterium]
MKYDKSNESRRKLLKSALAGSGAVIAGKSLPENWTKPVVESVLLPAHAQTSFVGGSYHLRPNGNTTGLNSDSDNLFARLVDSTIPTANAQISVFPVDYCVDVTANGEWNAVINSINGNWTATGTVGGGEVPMTAILCTDHPLVTFRVISNAASQVQIEIKEGGIVSGPSSLPAGICPTLALCSALPSDI